MDIGFPQNEVPNNETSQNTVPENGFSTVENPQPEVPQNIMPEAVSQATEAPQTEASQPVMPEPVYTEPEMPQPEVQKTEAPKAKSNKLQLIITIILGLLSVYAAGYVLIFDFIIPNEKDITTSKTERVLSKDEQFSLINYVPIVKNSFDYTGAYGTNVRMLADVEKAAIINTAYYELLRGEGTIIYPESDFFNRFKEEYCSDGNSNCFAFYHTSMNKVLSRMYGISDYEHADFQIGPSEKNMCVTSGVDYSCHVLKDYENETVKKVGDIILSQADSDQVILYEKVFFLDGYSVETINENTYVHHIDNIYKYINTPNNQVLETGVDINSESLDLTAALEAQCGNEAQLYKHIFKRATTGDFYWYSSEPVPSTEY